VTVHVASPAILWAFVALPAFLVGATASRVATACRVLAVAAVVLVLAGLSVERPRPEAGACVVVAIDVSASVQDAGREAARTFLGGLVPALGADDVVGSIAFASATRVLAHPEARHPPLEALVPSDDAARVDRDETDIAAAITNGAALCPPGKQASIVVFTDGNETEGSVLAEAGLVEPRVPVFPVVPPAARLPQAAVRRLIAPTFATAAAVLPLEAVVENRAPAPRDAALAIRLNGKSLLPVPVQMPPGVSAVRLPYRFDEAGSYLMEAELLMPPGEPPAAGTLAASLTVTPPIHVLVVSEHERPALAVALAQRGMDIELTIPAGFTARTTSLADYHLVVLDDVARAGLGVGALDRLAAWVGGGGALVVTGGAHLFGDPGFVGSALERVLPVALESQRPEPKQREPIALYLLIDRSNSMGYATGAPALGNGEKMEYAKRAALAVLDQLGPRDLVGAIAFDSQPYELGPLLPLAEGRAALGAKITQLQYGGGTDFKDALEQARAALAAVGSRVRHVVLLTDGDTNRRAEDHDDLITELAREEITVTSIRIGDDTVNLNLLERISRATGGAFHHVADVQALPQLMISDTQHLMDAALNRRALRPHVGAPGAILAGIAEDDLPAVSRWAITRAKPGAEVRLSVDVAGRRDPLLATWQYELGRVAAVPMDFQAGAAAWPTWNGFPKLWSQLARWAAPRALASARHLEARQTGDRTVLRLTTIDDEDGPFVLRLPERDDVVLHAVARRTFAGATVQLAPGAYRATLTGGGRSDALDVVVPARSPSGRELRASGPNVALLAALAGATGGRLGATPRDVLAARPGVARRRIPLDGVLVPLAIVLLLIDIGVRRLGGSGLRSRRGAR